MPRPFCRRLIRTTIACRTFRPCSGIDSGLPAGCLALDSEAIILYPDEAEALRYADLEGMYQEDAARNMGISRQTFGRIIESARRKVAAAILQGRMLRIEEPGCSTVRAVIQECASEYPSQIPAQSPAQHSAQLPASCNGSETIQKERMCMNVKIALVTDNGTSISRHFGRALYYAVVTIENGKVVSKELREKPGHAHFAGQHEHHGEESHGHSAASGHGFDPASQDRHARMAQAIADCEVLIAGGMGAGAYASLRNAGIKPLITDLDTVDEAVAAYLAGTLVDHPEYLH